MEKKRETLVSVNDEERFDYESEFGNGSRNRMIYDLEDLIKISKKNEGRVHSNIDYHKELKDIPNIKDKVFQVLYHSYDNEYNEKKIKTYILTSIVMGNIIKKRNNEYFVNEYFVGHQDIFLKQYRKLKRWI